MMSQSLAPPKSRIAFLQLLRVLVGPSALRQRDVHARVIGCLFLLGQIPLMMLQADAIIVDRHLLLGLTLCLQDLLFVAII